MLEYFQKTFRNESIIQLPPYVFQVDFIDPTIPCRTLQYSIERRFHTTCATGFEANNWRIQPHIRSAYDTSSRLYRIRRYINCSTMKFTSNIIFQFFRQLHPFPVRSVWQSSKYKS